MAQEDHTQRCSYSGGGGSGGGGGGYGGGVSSGCSSKSKKIKKTKLPQRGLGVAQLERIRIEEQQKREAALQVRNVLANNNNNNLPSPNLFFRPSPEIEISNQSLVRISSQLNVISSHGHGNWPGLLNSEYNLEIEKQRLDHHGFAFGVNLPYGRSVPQRSHQFQHHFSSMVNAPSTVPRYQTEPPSNQSFCSNYYHTPLIPEEDEMFGMKRPYPLSLETPQPPSFKCFPGSRTRSDEVSGSSSNIYTHQVEPRTKTYIRDDSSSSSGISNVDGKLNRDFLTLAPPSLDSKQKHQEREPLYDSKCMATQENARSEINQLGSMEPPEQQQPFSFFPVKMQTDQTSTNPSNGSDEKCETIDLNLKL